MGVGDDLGKPLVITYFDRSKLNIENSRKETDSVSIIHDFWNKFPNLMIQITLKHHH